MAANGWDLLSSLVWPVAIGAIAIAYKKNLDAIVRTFTDKFEKSHEIKIGSIELKGPVLDPKDASIATSVNLANVSGNDYSKNAATPADWKARRAVYDNTRSLMLVHRIRPSKKQGQDYDISIFLARKTSSNPSKSGAGHEAARFNDVDFVEYYLGSYFGGGTNGAWFVVRDAENGFAMTTSAYGPPLCIARIHFHDGEVAETYRFLDFEMGPVFRGATES